MEKQYKNPAVLNATKRIDKLISFILSNSEPDEEWKEVDGLTVIILFQARAEC